MNQQSSSKENGRKKFAVYFDDQDASHPYVRFAVTAQDSDAAVRLALLRHGGFDGLSPDDEECQDGVFFVDEGSLEDQPSEKAKRYSVIEAMGLFPGGWK